jgi:hypothetical protein
MSRDRAGSEDAFVTNYASRIILEVSILVLIESAAVWRFCWALVGGKRELRPLLLFRRGEVERLWHRRICSSPLPRGRSDNLTEASIECWLVREPDFQCNRKQ